MAQKYPFAHIVGWALEPPTVSVPESLKNLSFTKVDLFQPTAGVKNLQSGSVDFIFIRDMAYAIATIERWKSIIMEAYRVLRPGGWIEITEPGNLLYLLEVPPSMSLCINVFFVTQPARLVTRLSIDKTWSPI
jgi:ubiquinone/menaquinone biosynthesis C-methylase UbiE